MDRDLFFAAVTVLATTLGATAVAAGEGAAREESPRCLADLERAGRLPGLAEAASGRDLRALHRAAAIFARNGLEETCDAIAAGILALHAGTGQQRDEAAQARFEARLRNAPALDGLLAGWRAGELIGRKVVTRDGEAVGDVDDIMLGPDGRTRYLLIGSGGLLAVGAHYTPVESYSLQVVDADTLALPLDADGFEAAPRVGLERIDTAAEQWTREVQAWWSRNVHNQEALAR